MANVLIFFATASGKPTKRHRTKYFPVACRLHLLTFREKKPSLSRSSDKRGDSSSSFVSGLISAVENRSTESSSMPRTSTSGTIVWYRIFARILHFRWLKPSIRSMFLRSKPTLERRFSGYMGFTM